MIREHLVQQDVVEGMFSVQGMAFDEEGGEPVRESFFRFVAVQDQEVFPRQPASVDLVLWDVVPSEPVPDFVVDHVPEELGIQLGAFFPGELDPV